ncbi:hypothetical protein DCAR_0311595 [Daucus carota subsp. sativus]|uniref:Uncharacterized protein n=1 Tax=Daucus carota subsp. sativus TaxID=79200 RepID=A0AAF0WN06_DAUCS|nr:hypothetical protein DCAR_0311595 [Daucus carota subsp. sativus]
MSPVNITLIAAHRGEYISDDKDENVQEILAFCQLLLKHFANSYLSIKHSSVGDNNVVEIGQSGDTPVYHKACSKKNKMYRNNVKSNLHQFVMDPLGLKRRPLSPLSPSSLRERQRRRCGAHDSTDGNGSLLCKENQNPLRKAQTFGSGGNTIPGILHKGSLKTSQCSGPSTAESVVNSENQHKYLKETCPAERKSFLGNRGGLTNRVFAAVTQRTPLARLIAIQSNKQSVSNRFQPTIFNCFQISSLKASQCSVASTADFIFAHNFFSYLMLLTAMTKLALSTPSDLQYNKPGSVGHASDGGFLLSITSLYNK